MEFFRIKKDIPFMRHALVFNVISLITFILAVFFIITKGLHLSVEFTGGTVLEVNYTEAPQLESIRKGLDKSGYQDSQVQNFGTSRDVIIRVPNRVADTSAALSNRVFDVICGTASGKVVTQNLVDNKGQAVIKQACLSAQNAEISSIRSVEFVGPQVGKELADDGSLALLLVVIGIVIYLAIRFEWRFAVSAIIANLHDVTIIVGFFAFFQWEFSLPVLAAVLAVLGYSVNESVVVFDRVRETFRNSRMRGIGVPQVLDHAITSTISRTIITHGCTQMMVLSMLIFGGPTLHFFALALTIGICFGIYSSVLVASPLVMWMGVSREQFIKPVKVKEEAVV
ncbi:MAG TPA: protein translocase subunit SecF [Rhodocyclaceae bacterium]|nr:protein translocase subunit SecF [Rhodocyclaceae bacterium]